MSAWENACGSGLRVPRTCASRSGVSSAVAPIRSETSSAFGLMPNARRLTLLARGATLRREGLWLRADR